MVNGCDVRGDAGTGALGGDDTNSVFQLTLVMIKDYLFDF